MLYRLAQEPAVTTSACVMVTVPPQLSVATTAASFATGTAEAQLTVVLAGMLVIAGGVISFTVIVCEHPALFFLPFFKMSKVTVYCVLQLLPAFMLTELAVEVPKIVPAPVTVHMYVSPPDKAVVVAVYWLVEPGQTSWGPVNAQETFLPLSAALVVTREVCATMELGKLKKQTSKKGNTRLKKHNKLVCLF